MLNDDVISGQTAIGTVASTDELLISDAGVLKRVDVVDLADVIHDENTFVATITGYGNVTHNLGSFDVIVQCYDTDTLQTIKTTVERSTVNVVGINGNVFPSVGDIRVMISKVI